MKRVLDVTSGTKMMWFDKHDSRVLYLDKRNECFRPTGRKFADKDVEVKPDIQADFTTLPLPSESYHMVVFDPPQIVRSSIGNVTRYCGALPKDWREMLRKGFAECFRVLKPDGVLIFKWSEIEIPLREVLALTMEKPLFGHRSGKAANTHWVVFIKASASERIDEEVDVYMRSVSWHSDRYSQEDVRTILAGNLRNFLRRRAAKDGGAL